MGRYSGGKSSRFAFGDKIAIVEIKGVISQSSGIIEELQQYLEDEGVKAIILRIDSPGGGVGPAQEIHREIMKIKSKKKVVTSMGSVAASGGYYIACASDLIVANPGTITGSIGVIMQFSNFEEVLKKIGIKGVVLKSGEHKDIGSPFREMTPEEKRIMQEVLDNVHQQFIQAVSDGRKLDRSKVVEIADGRILTGEQAKNFGLVDRMGNLQDTIDITAKMVGIKGKPIVLYPKKRFSIWELLMRDMASAIIDILNEKGYEFNFPLQIK
ncbi:MAG: signal peptide peptidase SppA [Deltaproteobacteria bacterium CG03_land_8_20_14_0_80_45_14]|nr:MAG: signal peptide peptidase SppA [Deltaproteobacteria bacterium CG03_land_8_20_14_0_80_45_14]